MKKQRFAFASWVLVFVMLAIVGLLNACGGGGGASPTPTPMPTITSFVAAKSFITTGTSTTLTAVFANGTGTVNNGIGLITSGEAKGTGNVVADTTFRLTVTGAGGTLTKDVTVGVVPVAATPVITVPANVTSGATNLAASVPDQAGCTFMWTITGGTFSGGGTNASGKDVTFTAGSAGTLTLTCIGKNSAGDESAPGVKSINVVAAPNISSFTATPSTITAGGSATLSALFSGGTGILMPGNMAITSGVTVTFSPTRSTNYTLTVTNLAGSSIASTATVIVAAAPSISSFTATPPTIPAGGNAFLSASFFGGAGIITPGNIAITSGIPVRLSPVGNTTYTLTVTNVAGASITSTATVTVIDQGTFSITADNYVTTWATQRVASVPAKPGTTYTWFIGNGILTSGQNSNLVHYTAGKPGTLSLVCMETDSIGSKASEASVTVVAAPSASIFAQKQVHFDDTPLLCSVSNQANTSISWSISDGTINGAQTADVLNWTSPSSIGSVTLTANVQNQAGDVATSAKNIEVVQGKWLKHVRQTTARTMGFSSTTLSDGRVLAVGGIQENRWGTASADIFDPATGNWSPASSMVSIRGFHAATLLADGRVLVSGGAVPSTSAEIYNPTNDKWSNAGSMSNPRQGHTATLLPDGRVLIAGGDDGTNELDSAELFDPSTNTWSGIGNMASARAFHTANLLPNGRVLVAGGQKNVSGMSTALTSAEIYDPATNTWSSAGDMSLGRTMSQSILLPNGKVLFGSHGAGAGAELYDPDSNSWSSAGSMISARFAYTMTLLPNGKVLVSGGESELDIIPSAELYDPATNTWSLTGSLANPRLYHHANLLPNGTVLVYGGEYSAAFPIAGIEIYDPATETWSNNGCFGYLRTNHTATQLSNGKVLIAGGADNNSRLYFDTKLYDPVVDTFFTSAPMVGARHTHTATCLLDGKVLVAGGAYLDTAEIYDPAADQWFQTGSMSDPRSSATATLLPNGKVLLAGGWRDPRNVLSSAEIFDPSTGLWTSAGNMTSSRGFHTATLLPNGKVLLVGGTGMWDSNPINAELYDPVSNTWSSAGHMAIDRNFHTATLLPNGKVLVVGGYQGGTMVTELYDPSSNTWSFTGSPSDYRYGHTATLLPNGLVLVAGGTWYGDWSTTLYDFTTGTWSSTGNITNYRVMHTATLLNNGKVLVVGGNTEQPSLDSVEFYK